MTVPAPSALHDLADDLAATSLALARRFAAGSTMWCCSPQWPHHARHVAVEFVHPVIVGKRALPAVAVRSPDLVGELRASMRRGDILVAIADADDAPVRDAMRRAPAWGAHAVWIGAGPRPDQGAADHVLWLDEPHGEPTLAPHDGRFILLYHLLWELTHVCFEHPGLLKGHEEDCRHDVCVTCADEGRLAEVVAVLGEQDARVRTAEGDETVISALVRPLHPHDLVVVHAGSVIGVVVTADVQ